MKAMMLLSCNFLHLPYTWMSIFSREKETPKQTNSKGIMFPVSKYQKGNNSLWTNLPSSSYSRQNSSCSAVLAQCSVQLLMPGINQHSTHIACKDSDNSSDKAHEHHRKHGRFIFNMESRCFVSRLLKKKEKSGQSVIIELTAVHHL